jgi:hypothetical protein
LLGFGAAGWAGRTVTGAAVLLIGSAAMAAGTGNLPAGAQQRARDLLSSLGVAVPVASSRPSGPSPSASRTVTSSAKVTDPGGSATLLALCEAWEASKNPHKKAMTTEQLRDLVAHAGSKASISGFCAPLLTAKQSREVSAKPTSPTPTPSHSSNGNGNDNGQGQNQQQGQNQGQSSPSPTQ